jgi:hypothetical protein
MSRPRTRLTALAALALALALAAAPRIARAYDDGYGRGERYEQRERSFNDEYIFSTTRMVADWDAPPAIKVPLFPPAVVIDLVFLPAEVIAGFF